MNSCICDKIQRKADECKFGDTNEERFLEQLIMSVKNEKTIQKCIERNGSYMSFFRNSDISFSTENLNIIQEDVTIVVCQGCMSKTEDARHITRDVITVTRGINL